MIVHYNKLYMYITNNNSLGLFLHIVVEVDFNVWFGFKFLNVIVQNIIAEKDEVDLLGNARLVSCMAPELLRVAESRISDLNV